MEASNIPMIGYRNDSVDKNQKLYPIYNALKIDEIYAKINLVYNDKEKASLTANEAYKWFIDEAVNQPLKTIIDIIQN